MIFQHHILSVFNREVLAELDKNTLLIDPASVRRWINGGRTADKDHMGLRFLAGWRSNRGADYQKYHS